MRKYLIGCFMGFLLSNNLLGQNTEIIGVNASNNVHLIFESVIAKASVGNSNYVIVYEPGDAIIIAKGVKAPKTNLFVITEDGLMYNFLLQYQEELTDYYKMISKNEAINYLKPIEPKAKENPKVSKDSIPEVSVSEVSVKKDTAYSFKNVNSIKNLYKYDKKEYMRKIAAALSLQKNYYSRLFSTRENLVLQLMNIVYNANELYFYFEMENTGGTDYDIDYFNYAISTKKIKNRTNTQSESLSPIYTYHLPKTIKRNSKHRFVVVFKEFNISKNKVFIVEIKDKNGEQDIYIPIQHKQLNNPNPYTK